MKRTILIIAAVIGVLVAITIGAFKIVGGQSCIIGVTGTATTIQLSGSGAGDVCNDIQRADKGTDLASSLYHDPNTIRLAGNIIAGGSSVPGSGSGGIYVSSLSPQGNERCEGDINSTIHYIVRDASDISTNGYAVCQGIQFNQQPQGG